MAQAVRSSRSRFSSAVSAAAAGGSGAWALACRASVRATARMAHARALSLRLRCMVSPVAGRLGCGRARARKYDQASAVRPNQHAPRQEHEAEHDAIEAAVIEAPVEAIAKPIAQEGRRQCDGGGNEQSNVNQ